MCLIMFYKRILVLLPIVWAAERLLFLEVDLRHANFVHKVHYIIDMRVILHRQNIICIFYMMLFFVKSTSTIHSKFVRKFLVVSTARYRNSCWKKTKFLQAKKGSWTHSMFSVFTKFLHNKKARIKKFRSFFILTKMQRIEW